MVAATFNRTGTLRAGTGPKSGTGSRLQDLSVAGPRHGYVAPVLVGLLLVSFLLMEGFVRLPTAVQIGADEGFELVKATLCLKGRHLYTEVWNDQPPLHTFLVTQLLKRVSTSILVPRLLTVSFSVLLLASIFATVLRVNGLWAAGVTTGLIIASPGFLELSSSCMLEIPALATAVTSLCLLLVGPQTQWRLREILAGVLFGLAIQMKLVPVVYVSLAALIVHLQCRQMKTDARRTLKSLAVLGTAMVFTCVVADLLIDGGAYLLHFQQAWTSHFASAKSFDYGSADEHPFEWTVVVKNWDATVPAVLGLAVLLRQTRKMHHAFLPLAWLALSFTVFAVHKPWWPYYYIHTAIPLCWCGGIGIVSMCELCKARKNWPAIVAASLAGLCAASWMGARLYLQVADLRRSPQTYSSPVIAQMRRFQPVAEWLYADRPVYSFHSGIPMVPTLAVVPLKRLWSGEMTNARITEELAKYRPGLILLANDGRQAPFSNLLQSDYQLVYVDPDNRLFANRAIAKRAR